MALLKKLKKGGNARYALYGAVQNDTFTVPRGFRIDSIEAETLSYLSAAANITVGTAAGVLPIQTWTGNGTPVGGSTTTVTVDGIAVTVVQGDTSKIVLDKIMAAYASFVYTATTSAQTWTMVRTSDTVITVTGNVPKATSGITTTYGSITGFQLTSAQVAAGSVNATVVNATGLSQYPANYPGAKGTYGAVKLMTVQTGFENCASQQTPSLSFTLTSYSSTTVGSFVLNGVTYTPATAGSADVTGVAAAIVNAVNAQSNTSGLYAYNNAGLTVIGVKPSNTLGVSTNLAITYSFSITGATLGTVTHINGSTSSGTGSVPASAGDLTYYVNYSTAMPDGKVNVYVELQKMN